MKCRIYLSSISFYLCRHDAVELAKKYNQPSQISSLLAKYAQHLLEEDKVFQAIELYRKANHFLEGAKLLDNLARSETKKRSGPLRIKKLYVLAALLVEEHQQNLRNSFIFWPWNSSIIYYHDDTNLSNLFMESIFIK